MKDETIEILLNKTYTLVCLQFIFNVFKKRIQNIDHFRQYFHFQNNTNAFDETDDYFDCNQNQYFDCLFMKHVYHLSLIQISGFLNLKNIQMTLIYFYFHLKKIKITELQF